MFKTRFSIQAINWFFCILCSFLSGNKKIICNILNNGTWSIKCTYIILFCIFCTYKVHLWTNNNDIDIENECVFFKRVIALIQAWNYFSCQTFFSFQTFDNSESFKRSILALFVSLHPLMKKCHRSYLLWTLLYVLDHILRRFKLKK